MKNILKRLSINLGKIFSNGKKEDLPLIGPKNTEPSSPASSLNVEVKEVKVNKITIKE
jgi:hypothetical protein